MLSHMIIFRCAITTNSGSVLHERTQLDCQNDLRELRTPTPEPTPAAVHIAPRPAYGKKPQH